ncbi:hypothetical protein FEA50_08895 [Mannheimia haemolytica]|uniref:antA/AntB antirepressor family protein n=1 Tax=Mannheimia haemolytica TaxID=75985 RepID=UPI00115CEB8E|nr:antA/AntB antirepressor family protein [Mannheimia haemolytica]TRC12662.1 hypothetical protein FEA50_08895 [Mannheimia haemolytica]
MTNSSLITVFNGSISNQTVQLANARDLHSFLESNQDFSNWISNRISEYGFIQDEDYITLEIKTRGRPRKEYHITLDMGKELAMVERNEKGRQIRKYFIECERKMKELLQNNQQIAPLTLPEKPRKIQGTTRAAEGEYLYTREFSAMEIDHLAKLWDIAEEQHKFIESLTPLFETMQSEQWFKKHSRALNCFNHHNYSYHILSEMCEDVEEWTGIMPSIRAVKMKGKCYSRF